MNKSIRLAVEKYTGRIVSYERQGTGMYKVSYNEKRHKWYDNEGYFGHKFIPLNLKNKLEIFEHIKELNIEKANLTKKIGEIEKTLREFQKIYDEV